MTSPAPASDLSKLRINRDDPRGRPPRVSAEPHAGLGLWLSSWPSSSPSAAAARIPARSWWPRRWRERVVAAPGPAASASVTANGYVVARTRASVAAKLAGRIAHLRGERGLHAPPRRGHRAARERRLPGAGVTGRGRALDRPRRTGRGARGARRAGARCASGSATCARRARTWWRSRSTTWPRAARPRPWHGRRRRRPASQSADANLRFARANLENTVIRAPFTGTVLRKEAEMGEVVAPSVGGGLTRGAVVTMADLTTLEVEVDVNEAYIARVRKQGPARITLDAYPDTAFRGEVRQVVPTADRQRATVQVKVSIVDRDPRILPEMGARVDFLEEVARGDSARRHERAGRATAVPDPRGSRPGARGPERRLAGSRWPARVAPGPGRAGERRVPGDPLGALRRGDAGGGRGGCAEGGNEGEGAEVARRRHPERSEGPCPRGMRPSLRSG